ncbi:hypothetical protein H5410_042171 [Solanum commersonii]|uniref:Uncharacterized protein n=1 Tax=Solanum commersonii TaxID=4109 RepID=A0A9J5XU01_SOLCO|nr:hypothetical protein H5410_042171 [Solanum commersonii]
MAHNYRAAVQENAEKQIKKEFEWKEMIFPRTILNSSHRIDTFLGEKDNCSITIVPDSHTTTMYPHCFGFIKLRMLDEVKIHAKRSIRSGNKVPCLISNFFFFFMTRETRSRYPLGAHRDMKVAPMIYS